MRSKVCTDIERVHPNRSANAVSYANPNNCEGLLTTIQELLQSGAAGTPLLDLILRAARL